MDNFFIHKTADVSKLAKIGNNTKIWNNAQIREYAEIGENCIISKDVYIDHHVMIGNNCKIQNGVSIYTGVTIEDNIFIGPNVTFTNDKIPRAFNKEWEITNTLIKEGASLSAASVIICGITIGKYAMVGAGTVATRDIPDFALYFGNPGRFISWICKCGARVLNQGQLCEKCNKSNI